MLDWWGVVATSCDELLYQISAMAALAASIKAVAAAIMQSKFFISHRRKILVELSPTTAS